MANFIGTAKNDTLTGGDGSDQLFGLAGNDSLAGGLGDDNLDGGLGADTMAGGLGNDRYVLDAFGETITEAANQGRDLVTVRNTATLTKAIDNVEDYIFTGTARVSFHGSAGDNSITGAAASDTLFGEAGNDVLNGGAGADSLDGGDGSDIYVVDNAGDVVRETKEDISGGVDLVLSSVSFTLGSGVDRLELVGTAAIDGRGNDLANNMRGNNAANRLSALGGNDAFDGAGGNDTLDGGLGADTMFGGAGNDTYFVDDVGDVVTEEFSGAKGGIDTIFSSTALGTLGTNVENLTLTGNTNLSANGNELNNRITGNGGRNVLDGAVGNDTIDGGAGADDIGGGAGNDLLIGGTGNDTYRVDRGDKIVESAAGGTDTVIFAGEGNFMLGANLENLELDNTNGSATGNALDNIIRATGSNNKLLGLAGADTLIASNGVSRDTLDGGSGADRMEGGDEGDTYIVDNIADVVIEEAVVTDATNDVIRTTLSVFTPVANVESYVFLGGAVNFTGDAGRNNIIGTNFNDTLNGGGGDGDLSGSGGNDLLIATGQSDLTGGTGADTMIGASSNNGYSVDSIRDVVDELSGGDGGDDAVVATISYSLVANGTTLLGTIEDLFLFGGGTLTGTGNDLDNAMIGNDGATRMFGGLGNDTLDGRFGNDTLDGGIGDDRLFGGRGNDLLIVSTGNDTVVIQDKLAGRDLVQGFDGDGVGGQDIVNLDELFDSLGIATADRTAHLQITDKGSTVEIRIDTSVAGDGVFDYFAVTLQTADDITVGSDIIVV